jgi:TolB-like protein
MKDWLGPYRLIRRLGESGHGAVYAAEDARLGRTVALKTLPRRGSDLHQRERLLQEARMAAIVSHPSICQVYEVGEADGELYFAMELLEGESLEARLARGALPAREAVQVLLDVLRALAVLHDCGLVHRALRPASVFLTPRGPKLLDFALARSPDAGGVRAAGRLEPDPARGAFHYMAPEQLTGGACDRRTDVWAAGALLYELLTGHPPFPGTFDEVRQAALDGHVPPLTGSSGVEFLDRVVARALAPAPADRFPTAGAMIRDLHDALEALDSSGTARASRMTRLVVLPLQLLRPDPDAEFLAVSLADAIGTSLSTLGSLIVRSSLTAGAAAGEALDLAALAERLEVDVVVTGTLVRAAERVRVGVQLLEAPHGTVLWSQARQMPFDQLFDLQDELARGIAESLALPLTAREHRLLRHDVPATPRAYEHYLRANQVAHDSACWQEAKHLYEQCVEEDPRFAPAWARLGRIFRVSAKYGLAPDPQRSYVEADAAFKRALDLNPDLSIAHSYYAAYEVDTGHAERAITRLVTRAAARRGDADLRIGLVQACRFAGLLDASASAHAQARRLDPGIPSSVLHTWWAMGEYSRVLDQSERSPGPVNGLLLAALGRTREAIEVLAGEERRFANRFMSTFARMLRLALEGEVEPALALATDIEDLAVQDPEATYYVSRLRARLGDHDRALATLTKAVEGGYFCSRVLREDPWLDGIRSRPAFQRLVEGAQVRQRGAASVFREAGGEALLGVSVDGDV